MRSTTKPPESQNMNLASKLEIDEIRLLAIDYIKLSLKSEISEEEADRIGGILVVAETSDLLSFLINEIDILICEKLNISTEISVLDTVESLFTSYDLTSSQMEQEELHIETVFGFPGYVSSIEASTSKSILVIDSGESTFFLPTPHSQSYEKQAKYYEMLSSFLEQRFARDSIELKRNAFIARLERVINSWIQTETIVSNDASIDSIYLDLAYSRMLIQAKWSRAHHTKPNIVHFSGHGLSTKEIIYSWQNTNFTFEVIHGYCRENLESTCLASWAWLRDFHTLHSAFHDCKESKKIKLEAVSSCSENLHSRYLLHSPIPIEIGKSRPVLIDDTYSESVDLRTTFNDIEELDNLNNDKQSIFRILSTLLSSFINQSKTAEERLVITEQHKALVKEYLLLSILEDLSDSQADRISEIYKLAESDPTLNFIIGEIDHIVLQETGFFGEENLVEYRNQKARLEELIDLEHGGIQNSSIYKKDESSIGLESLIASLREAIKNQSSDDVLPTYTMQELIEPLKSQEQLESPFVNGHQVCLFTKRPILHRDFTQSSLQVSISELQSILRDCGLLRDCSGEFDAETEEAVKEFQRQNQLSVDGIVGPLTWACLFYPKLSYSRKEPCPDLENTVTQMQSILFQENFLSKEPDGRFDKRTERAVRRFQRVYGLKDDGIVGAATWAALLGMRQKTTKKFPRGIYLSTAQSWIFGEQLLIVSCILLGIYHSPLPGSPPMFTTALATSYALTYFVPFLLKKLPIKQPNLVSQTLLQYAPYVLTGMLWQSILNVLATLIK